MGIFWLIGVACPHGMVALMGQCLGVVKNSVSSSASDSSNCYWKSGDRNYQLAVVPNDQVWKKISITGAKIQELDKFLETISLRVIELWPNNQITQACLS